MTRDRRLQARKIPGELGFIQINRDEGGRILNISEDGLSFETFAPIERERLLRFWFSLDLHDRIEGNGRLAWLDAEGKVGGLRFLDLSAKARRHVRTGLGTQLDAHFSANAGAISKTTSIEKPRMKGSVFLAALAKRSPGKLALMPRMLDAGTFEKAITAAADLGSHVDSGSPVSQPAADSGSLNLMGLVSLEQHLAASRRQFLRGILLGVVFSLAVAAVGARYFVRNQPSSEASPTTALPASAPAGAPATQGNSGVGASETPGVAISPVPVSARQTSSRNSPDSPPVDGKSQPLVPSSGAVRGARTTGTASSPGSDAKSGRKPPATLQQLWAAVQGGNAKAAVVLADHYLQGDGVPVNCDQARVLLLVASEKNNADAIRKLRELDKTGCPTP